MAGITKILSLVNSTGGRVSIQCYENPEHPGNSAVAEPNSTAPCNMWIPWCLSADDFARGKHIVVSVQARPTYWIWQGNRSDGDAVRYSMTGQFHDPGDHIPGQDYPGGERHLDVMTGGLRLHI
jgi:hypothetical protein